MKYKRMLCWLQNSDEERLKAFNLTNSSIIFAHSEEECKSLISPETFVIISLKFAEDNIEKITNLVRKFPNITFYMFAMYEGDLTLNGFSISYEPNVDKKSLLTEEVIDILRQSVEVISK